MVKLFATLSAVAAIAIAPAGLALQAPGGGTASAETVAGPTLSPADRSAILKRASASLTDVKTAMGTFQQLAPDFSLTTGRFALSRPGKMRFEYDDPTPLLLVADGVTVALQDSELETTDRVPLGSTPLSLLLDDNIDLESEAEILDVETRGGHVDITLRDKSGEMDGTLTLILSETDMELTGWRTVDSGGNITEVLLADVEYGKKLNPRLFTIRDFEDD